MLKSGREKLHALKISKRTGTTNFHGRGKMPSKQGSKLTVASGELATSKSCLLPTEKVGSKKLLPGNSVVEVISGK